MPEILLLVSASNGSGIVDEVGCVDDAVVIV